ncbi:sodium:solute symporter family protein [Natrialba swarupiae]|uniref:Sodium:solute symporter family protein n=1 Tax=Natrialba swarupiae TaxID=2448032 RepID=A0A5D5AM12_9EURY|nr:sodium:solute symporter family protein [Natrialba swarupiae]TYT62114.1 sodium:solute symporter family protein [Natrialba swarupiae]
MSTWIYVGLALTGVYLAGLFVLSMYGGRLTDIGVSDYFVANGSLSSIVIFLTMIASAFSAYTFLGGGGIAYDLGIAGLVIIGAIVVTDFPIIVMLGEKIWKISKTGKDYVTPADLFADRYGGSTSVRVLVALIAVGFTMFYVTIQFTGMGLVLNVLTDGLISREAAAVIIGIAMAAYIAIGGMRGVAYTDALQAILLWGGMVAVTGYVLLTTPSDVYVNAAQQFDAVGQVTMDPLYLYTAAAGFGLAIPVFPHIWQRYYSSKRQSAVWAMGFGDSFSALVLLTIFPGLIAFAGLTAHGGLENPDTVILQYILEMPGPVLGILMAAAVAAAMSTADTMILMMGSIVSRDVYEELLSADISDQKLSRNSKIFSGLLALLALGFSLIDLGLLVEVAIDLAIPGYLLLLPPAIAAFWWPRANWQGTVAGLLVGLAVIWYYSLTGAPIPLDLWIGVPGLIASGVVLVAVSLVTAEPDEERVNEFVYELREYSASDLEMSQNVPSEPGEPSAPPSAKRVGESEDD